MNGYAGKFLRVNLSTQEIGSEPLDEQFVKEYIGGRGFGISCLYKETLPQIDALSEQNKLIMLTGPLTGTGVQSGSKWMIYTKSPLTGCLIRSVSGGGFGARLKFTGYDFIIIEGKAETPVYIYITSENCEIREASDLWGQDTEFTHHLLQERHGSNVQACCIGQAGENLVKFASVNNDHRFAARGGVGTVMGSKKLKAIAVNAKMHLQLHDPDGLKHLIKEQIELNKVSKGAANSREWGTTNVVELTNELGIYPVRNFRYGQQKDYKNLVSQELRKYRAGNYGCYSCAIRCKQTHYIGSGQYSGTYSIGPEYETIWAFSGPTDNANIEATIVANQLCDRLGLDTISTGGCIGFAYELYEKGLITKKDTDGLELTYGNYEAMLELIRKTANREGFGNILADGTMRAAKTIGNGSENYAIHVKGMELPGYDPRGAKSMGYNYATSNIGANHCYGYSSQEIFNTNIPRKVIRFAEIENIDIVIFNQNFRAMAEVGIQCSFTTGWPWFSQLFNKMLVAATGIEQFNDYNYLMQTGEKIINLERAYNVRDGFNRTQDILPGRMINEPLFTLMTPGQGHTVNNLDEFLDKYYKARGWSNTGIPTFEKLNELGIRLICTD